MITRESLLNDIARTDRQMMTLLETLSDEQLTVPYEPGINPPVWEIGHAAFFYEFFLLRRLSFCCGPARGQLFRSGRGHRRLRHLSERVHLDRRWILCGRRSFGHLNVGSQRSLYRNGLQ